MKSSHPDLSEKKSAELRAMLKSVLLFLVASGLFITLLLMLWFLNSPLGTSASASLTYLFATDTVQSWWYLTRAAGLTAYFLIWLSMVWGLLIPSKLLHPTLENTFTFDFHEFLSLLGLGFVALHVVVLLFDKFLPFNLIQILIPFTDTYRPLWVGMGILGFYLFLLVTVTSYLRQRIGTKAFRALHVLSLFAYLGATFHGLFAGTDSALPIAKILYGVSFLVVLFLTVFWIVWGLLNRRKSAPSSVMVPAERARQRR